MVSPEEFVKIWQKAKTGTEAAERLGLSLQACSARANRYRAAGVPLRQFKRGRNHIDADRLKKLITSLTALVVVMLMAGSADAGPFRRGRLAYQEPVYSAPTQVASSSSTPVYDTYETDGLAEDSLDEVNAARAAAGLRPYIKDPGLTQAAKACVQWRCARGLNGHTGDDFAFVPDGTSATYAGAEGPGGGGFAWHMRGDPWHTCCTYKKDCTYAGAASCCGTDGRRYMHLFVR